MRQTNVLKLSSFAKFMTISVALFAITSARAQKFNVNVHAGFDHATLRFSNASGGIIHYKTELTGGVGADAQLSNLVSIGLEGNFSQQGVSVIQTDGTNVTSIGIDYITVPLLLKLQAARGLSFYGGPQIGFLMAARQQNLNSPSQDAKDLLEKTDYYAVLGASYKFGSGVFTDVRFHQGFEGVAKDNTIGSLKNQYFSFRIGYSFDLSK